MLLHCRFTPQREENSSGVTSEPSVRALEFNKNVQFVEDFAAAEQYLKQTLTPHEVLLVMGSGECHRAGKNVGGVSHESADP